MQHPTHSPEWWLKRLTEEQHSRLPQLRKLDDYYSGDHPLIFATQQFREAFGGLFDDFSDNWCESVVNAVDERLDVTGFRFGKDDKTDDEAWEIWQRNGLDTESKIAHTEALVFAECYALIWPDENGKAKVTIEHPMQMIVARKANDRNQIAAALKWYIDDDNYEIAYLYLPDKVYRWRSRTTTRSQALRSYSGTRWVPEDRDEAEDPAEQDNPLAPVVPVVPIANKPRLVKPARSEIETIIPLQDGINKLWCDMFVASEYTADGQRYMLGWEPDFDENGQAKPPPWNRKDRFWFVPQTDKEEHSVTIGQFTPGDLTGFFKGIELGVNHVASQSRTPPHYLSPSADRLSGESIKASESGLVSKVRARMVVFGEAWELVLRLCFRLEGNEARAEFLAAETVWRDPEIRSDAEIVDAVTKKRALGVPLAQCFEDLGYTPGQVSRFPAMLAAETMVAGGAADADTARAVAELLQKAYLSVQAEIITAEEARELANRAGGQLVGPAPAAA